MDVLPVTPEGDRSHPQQHLTPTLVTWVPGRGTDYLLTHGHYHVEDVVSSRTPNCAKMSPPYGCGTISKVSPPHGHGATRRYHLLMGSTTHEDIASFRSHQNLVHTQSDPVGILGTLTRQNLM